MVNEFNILSLFNGYLQQNSQFYQRCFSYEQKYKLNAHAAMKMYGKDLFADDDYYVLDGGHSND